MNNNELRPCPFCGGKAIMTVDEIESDFYSTKMSVRVSCRNCGATMPEQIGITPRQGCEYIPGKGWVIGTDAALLAAQAWNRRANNDS